MTPDMKDGARRKAPSDEINSHHAASTDLSVNDGLAIPEQLRRRRDASRRLEPVDRRGFGGLPTPRPCLATRNASIATFDHFAALGLLSEQVISLLWEAAE